MNLEEFRRAAVKMVDYISDYMESISKRPITPNVSGGYLKSLLPLTAPNTGEPFDKIMEDLEKYIMPGLIHWQHPAFFAYFQSNSSYPSIISQLFKETLGCESPFGEISPSIVELDSIVLDWYGKLIGLPDVFLKYGKGSKGGAITQTSGSECILNNIICAREKFIENISESRLVISKAILTSSLVAYCSAESNIRIRKAAMLSMVTLKILDTDENFQLRGEILLKAIKSDKKIGFIPFFVCVTIGTYAGSCDLIEEIGLICKEYGIWLHVDAEYAGTAMICPEFKHLLNGIEYASSFYVNPAQWMLIHHDYAVLYVKDLERLAKILTTDTIKLGNGLYRNVLYHRNHITSRSFKLWFVMRLYGIEGLQQHIRHYVRLAKIFENNVKKDGRFEVLTSQFGIIGFRLNESDALNRTLLHAINASNKLLINSHQLMGKCIMLFFPCNDNVDENDIKNAWSVISECTDKVLRGDEKLLVSTECEDEYKYNIT